MAQVLTNEQLMLKADTTMNELNANGGILSPQDADKFVEEVIPKAKILEKSRIVILTSPEKNIHKVGFGGQIFYPGEEYTPLPESQRTKLATSKINYSTKKIKATIYIPYDVFEDNILSGTITNEGIESQLQNLIIRLIGKQSGLDVQKLLLLGDKTSSDPYLAQLDGWATILRGPNGNQFDVSSLHASNPSYPSVEMFEGGLMTLNEDYADDPASLINFLSYQNTVRWRYHLTNRSTGLGDSAVTSKIIPTALGVDVLDVPRMPEDFGILTDPMNLVTIIRRNITIQTQLEIEMEAWKCVITMRVGAQVQEPDAGVIYTDIGVAPTP